jgi:hypothetical protein
MTLGELYKVLGNNKARVKIYESDMTDKSGSWEGCPPELADRIVKKVWAVNNREDYTYNYGDFIVHIYPAGR